MSLFFWLGPDAERIAADQATREQVERERLIVVEEGQDYE